MRSCTRTGARLFSAACLAGVLMTLLHSPVRANVLIPPFPTEVETNVTWETDMDETVGLSRISLKPILVFFTLPNCPDCYRLKQFTLDNSLVQSPLRMFERLETDLAQRPELAMVFHIRSVPTLMIIEPDGRIRDSMEGYKTAREVHAFLARFIDRYLQPDDALAVIDDLKTGRATLDQWRTVLLAMNNLNVKRTLHLITATLSEQDRQNLAACLGDERLAVRLGALDLLEELNSGPPPFDPWAAPQEPEQKHALELWDQWARSGSGETRQDVMTLQDFDRYIRDVIGDNPDRSRIAMHVLYTGGKNVARWLSGYLKTHPKLNENALRRIKEIQYALVIPPSPGIEPQALAHRILWGNQDVRIRSIRQLSDCGIGPSAILADLLNHPDTLIRETAVEILFNTAGNRAIPHIKDFLALEKDPDLIFTALKHLSDTESFESQTILESYFTHDNEDLVIAAIEGVVSLSKRPVGSLLAPLLQDKRWRVRVAALEGIREKGGADSDVYDRFRGKKMAFPRNIANAVTACLNDPDEFVRHTAAVTLGELHIIDAAGDLKKAYDAHPEMRAVIVSVLIQLDSDIPGAYMDALFGPEPDDLLTVLSRIKSITGNCRALVHRAAESPNPDVACSALRILAETEKRNSSDNAILAKALTSGSNEKRLTVIQEFDMDSDNKGRVKKTLNQPDHSKKTINPFQGTTDADVLLAMSDLLSGPSVSGPVQNDAMITLCQYGHEGAFDKAFGSWDSLTSSMKTKVVRSLALHGEKGIPIFKLALNDDNSDVWEAALNQVRRNDKTLFAEPLRDVLLSPDCRLSPSVIWSEGVGSLCRNNPEVLMPFVTKVLGDVSSHREDQIILALTILSYAKNRTGEEERLVNLCRHDNPFVRRSAWIARIAGLKKKWLDHVEDLVSDSSSYVRDLVPTLLQNNYFSTHYLDLYFSGEESYREYDGINFDIDDNSYEEPKLSDTMTQAIRTLSQTDPDPMIRFKSILCLLTYHIPYDLNEMIKTAKQCGKPAVVADHLSRFISTHGHWLGKSFMVLLPLLEAPGSHDYGSYIMDPILERWGVSRAGGKASAISFESLPEKTSEATLMATFTTPSYNDTIDDEFPGTEIHFFTSPDCFQCDMVAFWIDKIFRHNNGLKVIRHNILTREGFIRNESFSRTFRVDEPGHAVVPSIFATSGYLIGREIKWMALGDLMSGADNDFGAEHLFETRPDSKDEALDAARERMGRFSWADLARQGLDRGSQAGVIVILLFLLSYLARSGLDKKPMAMAGGIYLAGVAATSLLMWIFPEAALSLKDFSVKVRSVIMWLIAGLMVTIVMGHFFRSFPGIRKRKNPPVKTKPPFQPTLRRVMAASSIWGILVTLFCFVSMGNEKTATFLFMIREHSAIVKPVLMTGYYCLAFLIPSAAILGACVFVTSNQAASSFFSRQTKLTHILLCLIWASLLFKLFRGNLPI